MLSKVRYYIVLLLCLFCSAIVFAVPKEMRSTNPFTASISVSGNSVEYEFILKEIQDESVNISS